MILYSNIEINSMKWRVRCKMKLALLNVVLIIFIAFSPRCISKVDPCTFFISADNIEWPSRSVQRLFETTDRFICENIIPTRFQAAGFWAVITFPRLKSGVPITLGRAPLIANRNMPSIKPFPTWEMQDIGVPGSIQNAVDIYLDENNILWVLDSGIINSLTYPEETGPPKVFGINFVTGKVQYEIDLTDLAENGSKCQYVVAETDSSRTYIYVSCSDPNVIIVWDVRNERGRCVSLPQSTHDSQVLQMVLLRPFNSRESILAIKVMSQSALVGLRTSLLRRGTTGEIMHLGELKEDIVILGTDNESKIYFRKKGDSCICEYDLGEEEESSWFSKGNDRRSATHVTRGSRSTLWSLESNFQSFMRGEVGQVGISAVIKPLKD